MTGVALMGVLALLRSEAWTARVSTRWWLGYYGANLLLPLGMCAAAGLWSAVAVTLVVLGALGAVGARTLRSAPAVWRGAAPVRAT